MRILVQNEWRIQAIFTTIVLMTGSLFICRALLSVSLILFIALTVVHTRAAEQLRRFFQTPLLAGFSFLFFIPFLSGFWSTDLHAWLDVTVKKLPFLLLPLAFAGEWRLKEKDWRLVGYCFILLLNVGTQIQPVTTIAINAIMMTDERRGLCLILNKA